VIYVTLVLLLLLAPLLLAMLKLSLPLVMLLIFSLSTMTPFLLLLLMLFPLPFFREKIRESRREVRLKEKDCVGVVAALCPREKRLTLIRDQLKGTGNRSHGLGSVFLIGIFRNTSFHGHWLLIAACRRGSDVNNRSRAHHLISWSQTRLKSSLCLCTITIFQ
jgi:hypothetical protein